MFKRTQLYQAVAAALFVAAQASNVAYAVREQEPNDAIFTPEGRLAAQVLSIDTEGKAEVMGAIGVTELAATAVPDVDFYAFDALEGDLLSIDIDGGMKPFDLSVRSVDTLIAVFGPLPNTDIRREHDDILATDPIDADSHHIRDAIIPAPNTLPFRVPASGTYVVGVSSKPRAFQNGGTTVNTTVTGRAAMFPNGAYKLIISGVTPPVLVQHINIDVKPGNSTADAYLNPKAKGTIPVAILSHGETRSSAEFKALDVDPSSLTFGKTGNEKSHVRCLKPGIDVNADGRPDLVCHFDNELAGWQPEDREGIIKGKTKDGKEFVGAAPLKVKQKAE